MKNQSNYYAGSALITGSVIMVVTMVMHPTGGGIEHLRHIASMIIITHSLAILSIPVTLFGFWGLTRRMGTDNPLVMVGFITICMGLFAVMLAAALNGLALPLFINGHYATDPDAQKSLGLLLSYNQTLNHAFDYIFIGGVCLAVMLWSIVIIGGNIFPKWVAYFGLVTCIMVICSLFAGFIFVDLTGFRIFIAGLVVWMMVIGVMLKRKDETIKI
ncbi:MAG: hypothetical protein V4577_13955 [Bacteroidota bacterium]